MGKCKFDENKEAENSLFNMYSKEKMPDKVQLREVKEDDLSLFFEQQLDRTANWMAAFTAKDPADRDAFNKHWAKVLADEGITIKTILYAGQVAGYVLSHGWFGEPEISYWLGREFWGRGIATTALNQFLAVQKTRPLVARAAKDNIGSIRVLEKCGFIVTGTDRGYAHGRGAAVEELIFRLD